MDERIPNTDPLPTDSEFCPYFFLRLSRHCLLLDGALIYVQRKQCCVV